MKIDKTKIDIKMTNVLEGWASKFDSVKRWLPKIQKKRMSALNLYHYCYWAEMTPNELLELKNNTSSTAAEEMLDTFVADDDTGLTEAEKYVVVIAVKSFFKHNYKDLARASGAIQYTPKAQYKPTKEDLQKLYRQCYNPRDRSMLTLICSTGIAKETLSNLTWRHLEEDWRTQDTPHISIGSELLKGHGRGKYAGVRQETFLTPEAKRDLIEYKEWIEKKMGRIFTKEDNIYVEVKEPFRPLSYDRIGGVFDEMAERAGVPFSLHDARRYVQTALEEARIPSNWARKIRGRKVRGEESPYSKPAIEQLRSAFRETVPKLQFLTAPAAISESDLRIKNAIDNLRMSGRFREEVLEQLQKKWLGKPPETAIRNISLEAEALQRIAEREGISRSDVVMIPKEAIEEEMEQIRRERKHPKTATNGGCANSRNCQRIVSEEELPNLLAQGWRVSVVLPSGKVVISNE